MLKKQKVFDLEIKQNVARIIPNTKALEKLDFVTHIAQYQVLSTNMNQSKFMRQNTIK